jgi:hypothetical protein
MGHMAGSTKQCQRSIAVPIIAKGFKLSRGCAASEAQRDALATVRRFNARLSAKGYVWFWPKIAAALTSRHHWLVIVVAPWLI